MSEKQTKRALVIGLADSRSIAGGILQAMAAAGWEAIAVAHSNPTAYKVAQQRGLRKLWLADTVPLLKCDVSQPAEVAMLAAEVEQRWPEGFDYLVHAVVFTDKSELQGDILDSTAANMKTTMHISAFSLVELCKAFETQLRDHGSVLTLTFAGSQYNAPNYNAMGPAKAALEGYVRYLAGSRLAQRGIRVNAISAGPIPTMSASAIDEFNLSLFIGAHRSVTGANVTPDEGGLTAVHLLQMPGVTGHILPVDHGIHLAGMGSSPKELDVYRRHRTPSPS